MVAREFGIRSLPASISTAFSQLTKCVSLPFTGRTARSFEERLVQCPHTFAIYHPIFVTHRKRQKLLKLLVDAIARQPRRLRISCKFRSKRRERIDFWARQLTQNHIWVRGDIRAGRTPDQRTSLMLKQTTSRYSWIIEVTNGFTCDPPGPRLNCRFGWNAGMRGPKAIRGETV